MSYDTNKTWLYRIEGRDIHLYQYIDGVAVDTLGSYKIALPNEYYGSQLIYPNEDITDGLRIEYTHLGEPFVSEELETTTARFSGTTIEFSHPDISESGNAWITSGFYVGDRVRVIGSASNDGDYTIAVLSSDCMSITDPNPSGSLVSEAAGESITVYQIPKEDSSPSESSHVNLNRMLSLACVDYVKAMVADLTGDIQKKEYYMRDFWKKIGDNASNKRKIFMTFPVSPFAVR